MPGGALSPHMRLSVVCARAMHPGCRWRVYWGLAQGGQRPLVQLLHTTSQPPQLAQSTARLTQRPRHVTKPVGHCNTHAPATHLLLGSHGALHAPQLAVLVDRSAHTGAHLS